MKNTQRKHIMIVRTNGSTIDYNTYNCQEIGLARSLTNQGFAISVVFAGVKYEHIVEKVNGYDLNIYYLPYSSIHHTLAWFKGYSKLLKSINPDIIQIHDLGNFMSYWTIKLAKKLKVKTILIQGGYQTTLKPIFKQTELLFNNTLGRYIIKNVDAIGCKTLMAEEYVNHISKCSVELTPIGLDDSRFKDHCDKIDWREQLNIQKKKILLYVGVLETRRNISLLIQTLHLLPNDYVLIIVGEGSELENAKRLMDSLNLNDRCFFIGKLPQASLPSMYKTADIFLLASNYEIYGMVILEAMYFGLPVVSSITAGSQTIIENEKDGILISEFDKQQWANIILSIGNNKVKLENMSREAYRKIHSKLLWENAVRNFVDIYKSLIK